MSKTLTNSAEITSKTTKTELAALVHYLESELHESHKTAANRGSKVSELERLNSELETENNRLRSLSESKPVSNFPDEIKKLILSASHPVHPTKKIGHFRLKRTMFPAGEYDTLKAAIDKPLHMDLAALAMRLGLTTDELQRRSASVLINLLN